MASLLNDLPDDRQETTFHLIRLPKETCERGSGHVANLTVDPTDGSLVLQDNSSNKIYSVISNYSKTKTLDEPEDGHDLVKVSLNREELVHLGKVDVSTLICVPKEGV